MELELNADYPCTYQTGEGFITSIYYSRADLNKEQLTELSKSRINLLKTVISSKDVLPDISTKDGKKIMETAACLLK